MPRRAIPQQTWEQFFAYLAAGKSKAESRRLTGISKGAVERLFTDPARSSGAKLYAQFRQHAPEGVNTGIPAKIARDTVDDFGVFRRRYFGRLPTPWQVDAANQMIELLDKGRSTGRKQYVVVNAPPGSGKSTLFTHDIPVWMLCRDRSLRILIGSRTGPQAELYTSRIRRTLDRADPPLAPERVASAGLAVDAKAVVSADFGRFRPERTEDELWRRNRFTVISPGRRADDKEASVTAYGLDGDYLGGRFDVVIWDDAVDRKNIRNPEQAEELAHIWETEIEPRLEPGGLFILQGQRLGAQDLYRTCLDKVDADGVHIYSHIVFPAHDEARCKGEASDQHELDSPPAPYGCLLDPIRLPWDRLRTLRDTAGSSYRVVYQQEDVDPDDVLVPKIFLTGGVDPKTKLDYPGCWDEGRTLGQIPEGLSAKCFSVLTADPSPTKFWAIMWWLYDPETRFAHLIEFFNDPMGAPSLLDYVLATGTYTGLLEDWWQMSSVKGRPITHAIVEFNAAQRFLLQYDYAQRWKMIRGVNVVGHQTQAYKSDEKLGIPALRPHFQFGRVRLPGASQLQLRRYVNELTHYPAWPTDDTVLSTWFLYWTAPKLLVPRPERPHRQFRPSWMTGRTRRQAA